MQFLYPALTIGFFLAILPPLIHLINMMRHRRVQWAAMEFLLQSHKRHRTWVWLKQLMLLLLRIAVILLIVAMLAQLVTQRRYEGIFGSHVTHHYLLLDDSFSMTDRGGGTSAFEQSLTFLTQLGTEASQQELPQRFTIIRFSQAQAASDSGNGADEMPVTADLNAEKVDAEFRSRLEELRRSFEPSQSNAGPHAALRMVRGLMNQNQSESRIVYLVSDFRANQWETPRELQQLLADLEHSDTRLQFVNCALKQRSNLAITDLQPADETRAAGVPLFVNVTVTNFGQQAVDNVQLKVKTTFYDKAGEQQASGSARKGETDEVPLIEISRIEAGASITERVQVYFPDSGRHVIEAMLPDDPVAADNHRWCVIDFPDNELVLVVDGDSDQRNAFYLEAIFQPGQRARTGIQPEFQNVAFLRDTTPESLAKYQAIYLFDVARMDERAIDNLQAYVAAGGGLAIFAGPQLNVSFYNDQLFRDGDGLFPVPLARDDLLMSDPLNDVPDLEVLATDHPVFRELQQGQNPIIRMVHVERFLRLPSDWIPDPDSTVQILARLRNRAPLAIEKRFGQGRVIAFLSTFAPDWNDMVLGPGVLVALRLQSYLGYSDRTVQQHQVGMPIEVQMDADQFRSDLVIFAPGSDPSMPRVIERMAEKQPTDSHILQAAVRADEVNRAGVYEILTHELDGEPRFQRYAINVDPGEGDLARTPEKQLLSDLAPLSVEMLSADQAATNTIQQAGYNQSLLLMVLLVVLLLLEQFLAYLTSFHPARRTVR